MKMLRLLPALLLLAANPAFGQAQDLQSRMAEIEVDQGRTVTAAVIAVRDDNLVVSAAQGAGTLGIPIEKIVRCDFFLPEAVLAADGQYRRGEFEAAVETYKPYIATLLRLAAYPKSNAATSVLNSIDAQRQLGDFEAVASSLAQLGGRLPEVAGRRAALMKILLLIDQGELTEAEGALSQLPEAGAEPTYGLEAIARARLAFANESPTGGSKSLGECLANLPINDPQYPEALALAYLNEKSVSDYAAILAGDRSLRAVGANADLDTEINSNRPLEFLEYCYPDHYWTARCKEAPKP